MSDIVKAIRINPYLYQTERPVKLGDILEFENGIRMKMTEGLRHYVIEPGEDGYEWPT